MLTKIDEYLAAGISHVWVVDPYRRTVFEADREGVRRCPSCVAHTDLTGPIDFAALFSRLGAPRS
jgi:Uma2 family endonuclease